MSILSAAVTLLVTAPMITMALAEIFRLDVGVGADRERVIALAVLSPKNL
jgi:hypothetical protein